MVAQKALHIVGNKLANERTKRRHMQNELQQLKIKIQKKDEDITHIKENLANIKNKSMTTEERLNELNKIYEVSIFINIYYVIRNSMAIY